MTKIIGGIITAVLLVVLCSPVPGWGELNLPIHGKIQYTIASWYGHAFHGKQTASGQLFDMHSFTCAHKSYPFGTWLKITNMVNNKSTFCEVNDRGPFEAIRDLDLSYAAARVLDMISLGTCVVRIEYLGMDLTHMKILKDLFHDRHFTKSAPRNDRQER
jgi:rare lipoprotein A